MNEFEKIASRNIHHAINWIVGGWYNCLQDDTPEDIPDTKEDAFNEIYTSCMNNAYGPGFEAYGKAPKEMRFASSEFIKNRIEKMLAKDGDWEEIAMEKGW